MILIDNKRTGAFFDMIDGLCSSPRQLL
jgi:hypothetical protein